MNDCAIKEIRQFNRYYTAWLDVMNEGSYMDTDLSWPRPEYCLRSIYAQGYNRHRFCVSILGWTKVMSAES